MPLYNAFEQRYVVYKYYYMYSISLRTYNDPIFRKSGQGENYML